MVLSMLLDITASVFSIFLRFGRRLLRRALNSNPKAIKIPTVQEIIISWTVGILMRKWLLCNAYRHYKEAISAKYSLLHDFYAMVDGLKLYLQESGNGVIQNMFYNG